MFLWEKIVYIIYGGIILSLINFGCEYYLNVFVYEFGYVLGLWYVYYGVLELDCIYDCVEIFFLFELGDLCFDINLIFVNNFCWDLFVDRGSFICGIKKFLNMFYRNYMSYVNDFCMEFFIE